MRKAAAKLLPMTNTLTVSMLKIAIRSHTHFTHELTLTWLFSNIYSMQCTVLVIHAKQDKTQMGNTFQSK